MKIIGHRISIQTLFAYSSKWRRLSVNSPFFRAVSYPFSNYPLFDGLLFITLLMICETEIH